MNVSSDAPKYITKTLNDSTDAKLEIYHEELFGGPAASFVYRVLMFLNHIIGPILLGEIIAFERYGGDPQKRNKINRVQSFGLANVIMCSTIHGLVQFVREIVGLIDLDGMSILCICMQRSSLFCGDIRFAATLHCCLKKSKSSE